MKKKSILLGAVLALSSIMAACNGDEKASSASGDDWKPTKPIEFIVPAGAGGGWDTTARAAAKVLEEQKIVNQRFAAVNKPGGGGAIGWAYIDGKKKDDHLLFPTSPPIMFVPLNGQSDLGHKDFTPIAALTADYAAYLVKSDSPFQNMNDLVDAMKKDPKSISVVGDSAPGSMDHMQFVKSVSAAGVDAKNVKYVSAQDGGGMTMLLGGQVEVYSTGVGEAVEQVRAGNVRVLGVTSAERIEGDVISDFPTLKEQGIDDVFVVWRGIMGPKDMSPEAAKYYENALKEMTETDAWKEELDRYGWLPNWMGSEEFSKFLDEEYDKIDKLMTEIGLKK
ncbi:Bug family tripartite tricarboxylate transporter substrate binding protein [Sporosarcina koreensis]|uniref:Bug family tripartite tricarboxylate transporter substrate binding protein n=1 Tax=Sporosarcina koreensis TaxID=334735 RepID=A0ABW0U2F2_9BACL